MQTLAIGGVMGAGKSMACDYLCQKLIRNGICPVVIDTDKIAQEVFKTPEFLNAISARFSWAVDNGVYHRNKMRQHLSQNPQDFADLNAISHPMIFARMPKNAHIIVSPLFSDALLSRAKKRLWIHADTATLMPRLRARGLSDDYIHAVLARQTAFKADFIVDNNADTMAFFAQLDRVYALISS